MRHEFVCWRTSLKSAMGDDFGEIALQREENSFSSIQESRRPLEYFPLKLGEHG